MVKLIRFNVTALYQVTAALLLFVICSTVFAVQTEIEFYKNDNAMNQLPLLDNRFRIDAQLDEVILLFYRTKGSPPIILVRPDGTKLKVNHATRDEIEWYDDSTYDLIKLKKPMPGPWQAIGAILPESKIMVLSEIKLAVEPLPEILLAGETIKITAKLFNGGLAINNPDFRDVVTLNVNFFSTINPDYDNYGAEPVQLTSFRDDGYDLDEYAADGIFTGEFELDLSPGEWQPVYSIELPMAARKLEQQLIILQASPITLTVEQSRLLDNPHRLTFNIDATYVDPDSIILQGKITYPDRQVEQYSIVDGKGKTRVKDIPFTEGGIHRVKTNVFGKTVQGREFRLALPEFSFSVEHEGYAIGAVEGQGANKLSLEEEKAKQAELRVQALEEEKALKLAELEEKKINSYIFIAVGNGVVIVIAALLFFLFKRKQKK